MEENLNIESYLTGNLQDILDKYDNHPSIKNKHENVRIDNNFSFNDMTAQDVENEIINLNIKKALLDDGIPTKFLIKSDDIVSNKRLKEIKITPLVIPVHKNDERALKNYRPVLPVVSKLFERNMYNQIIAYIDKFLSPYLFGFRSGHSTEQCLSIMLDGEKNAGAILTDLSKATTY